MGSCRHGWHPCVRGATPIPSHRNADCAQSSWDKVAAFRILHVFLQRGLSRVFESIGGKELPIVRAHVACIGLCAKRCSRHLASQAHHACCFGVFCVCPRRRYFLLCRKHQGSGCTSAYRGTPKQIICTLGWCWVALFSLLVARNLKLQNFIFYNFLAKGHLQLSCCQES